jgi:signal recognition particle subunit SRP54
MPVHLRSTPTAAQPTVASTLTDRLSRLVKTMRGEARITESNVADMLREVRMALLEADVALPVVRDFIARVKDKALGQEVVGSLNPGQALVGIVHKELAATMGEVDEAGVLKPPADINLAVQPPAVILMAGLQGSGKTTTTAKLTKHLITKRKKKVLTVSADVYRPAAIEQLKTVTAQAGGEWFESTAAQKPRDIALAALDHAKRHYFDVLIIDTAGRLGIDEALMAEIRELHACVNPVETLFVVDAMQGQDAVNVAKAFKDALPLTGVVLTKLDGDSRGGAALSVRQVTGAPIKFAGVSEKIDGLEVFDAERHAGRVLGMGDILALVEEVQKGVDLGEAKKLADKMKSGSGFDLDDFLSQLSQMKKMGGLSGLMDKLPAQMTQKAQGADMDRAERDMKRMEGIIRSMNAKERRKPDFYFKTSRDKASRKRRIAAGAGVHVQEVNRLLTQFEQMQGMMKKMQGGGLMKMMKRMGGAMGGKGGMGGGGGFPGMPR